MANEEALQYITKKLNSLSESLLLCLGSLYSTNETIKNDAKAKISTLIDQADDLCTRVGVKYMEFNSFCNTLMLIKNLGVPKAKQFLDRHAYEERVYTRFNKTIEKFKFHKELTEFDYKLTSLLITTDTLHDEDKITVAERLIKDCLQKNNHITMDVFIKIMKMYTEVLMQEFIDDPVVITSSSRKLKGAKAYSILNQVELNEDELRNMYSTSNFEILKAIFHEVRHIWQLERIKEKDFEDELVLRMYKDDVLSSYLPGYYDENYERTSLELDAEVYSLKELLKFFQRNNITFKDVHLINEDIDRLENGLYDSKRLRGGRSMDIDDLFEHVVKFNSDLLSNYEKFIRTRKDTND